MAHPHMNCPHCRGIEVPADEIIAFLVHEQGRRSWTDNVKRMLQKWNITRKP